MKYCLTAFDWLLTENSLSSLSVSLQPPRLTPSTNLIYSMPQFLHKNIGERAKTLWDILSEGLQGLQGSKEGGRDGGWAQGRGRVLTSTSLAPILACLSG